MMVDAIPSSNDAGYKGVTFLAGRYQARIRIKGKKHSLGYFDTPEEAGRAYAAKAKEIGRGPDAYTQPGWDTLPSGTRVRSALQAYLDDGGTVEALEELCFLEETRMEAERYLPKDPRPIGAIFRIEVPGPSDASYGDLKVRVLKIGENRWRFGHSVKELEGIRMLYGIEEPK